VIRTFHAISAISRTRPSPASHIKVGVFPKLKKLFVSRALVRGRQRYDINLKLCISSLFQSLSMLRPAAESELVRLLGDVVAYPHFYIAICITGVLFFD